MNSKTRLLGIAGWIFVLGFVQAAWSEGDKSCRQVQIHLGSSTTPKSFPARLEKERPKIHAVSIKKQTRIKGSPPKRRTLKISWQELVVVALDDKGHESDRVVVPDPRLVRYESTDPSGKFIDSAVLYRDEADLTVVFREHPGFHAVRVFQPRWTGKEYVLDLLGEAALP